jgi:hypothetical protein
MAGAQGWNSYIQFGREGTYGSDQAATHKLEILSEDIAPKITSIRDPSLYNARSRRGIFQGPFGVGGKFKVRSNYEGLSMLLDWFFGTSTFGAVGGLPGTPTGTPTSIYPHTFVELPLLNSYTLEVIKGNVAAGTCYQVVGAKCNGLTFAIQATTGDGAMMTTEVDVVGKDVTSDVAVTSSLTLPPVTPILYHQCVAASIKDGSGLTTAARITALEISLSNNLNPDDYYLGSLTADEPVPIDFITPKWKFTAKYTIKTVWDLARTFTGGVGTELQMTFNDALTTVPRSLIFHSKYGFLTAVGVPTTGPGYILQDYEYEPIYDATDVGCIKVTNGCTTATVGAAYPVT